MSRPSRTVPLTAPRRRRPALGLRTVGLLVLVAAVLTAGAPSAIQIHRGDTLSAIALRHHTTVATLQALNHMGGSTTIYAGGTLILPGTPDASRPAAGRPVTRTVLRTYTVRPGDGLIVVARTLHTTPAQLISVNHLRRNYLLLGEHLRYPVRVTTRAAAPSTGATVAVPGSVSQSAATHRTLLRARAVPSKAAVRDLVARAARRHGVPVDLALALAYQESGFQQRVVSPVDAIGAMQVLPSTGRSLGRLHGRTFDLLKASDNVEAGVMLLRDLLQATETVERALAGYYQGLGSMGRVGLLPQTKQYIRNVQLLRQRFS
jgi:LysM repeat protein